MALESKDGVFKWEEFRQKVTKDLNDNLGNFVNRVLRFSAERFGLTVPQGGVWGPDEDHLQAQCAAHVKRSAGHLETLEFRKATEALRDFCALEISISTSARHGRLSIQRAKTRPLCCEPA